MDEEKIVIREAVKNDAPGMLEYLNRIGTESDFLTFQSGEELHLTVSKLEKSIETSANRKNAFYLIAEIDGKIIGNLKFSGGLKARTEHTGEFGISILQAYGGKGIGSKMLVALIAWSKGTQIIRKINLRVRSDNEKALHLYKKFGFVQEGVLRRDFLMDGVFYDSIAMGLLID